MPTLKFWGGLLRMSHFIGHARKSCLVGKGSTALAPCRWQRARCPRNIDLMSWHDVLQGTCSLQCRRVVMSHVLNRALLSRVLERASPQPGSCHQRGSLLESAADAAEARTLHSDHGEARRRARERPQPSRPWRRARPWPRRQARPRGRRGRGSSQRCG